MGVDRYIYRAGSPQFDAAAIKFSSDTLMYKDHRNELIMQQDSASTITMDQMVTELRSSKTMNGDFLTIPADHVSLKLDKDGSQIAAVSIAGSRYMFKNHWILLDIMNNLKGRKICFPIPPGYELKGLDEFLEKKNNLWIYKN
jgi:hypothetical protein